jgi:hypothetical protein
MRGLAGLAVAGLFVGLATSLPAGQSPEQRPTFRAGSHFVRVDAYPRRDGRIVRDLAAADFEVFEDGRPQRIETFDFVEFFPWAPEASRRDPSSVQEGFRLAEDPDYRVFVFYYDVYHVEFMSSRRLEAPLENTIERMLGPRDLFGLLTPRQSPDELTLGQETFGVRRQLATILTANSAGADLYEPEEQALFVCYPWLSEEQKKALVAARRLEKVFGPGRHRGASRRASRRAQEPRRVCQHADRSGTEPRCPRAAAAGRAAGGGGPDRPARHQSPRDPGRAGSKLV